MTNNEINRNYLNNINLMKSYDSTNSDLINNNNNFNLNEMPKIYYDNKTFFGSYLDIYNERVDNNMFFPNLSFTNYNENNNEDNKFFGAFQKSGNKLILNIPNSNRIEEMKKNLNNNNKKKDENEDTEMKDIEKYFLNNNNDISQNDNNSMDICNNNNNMNQDDNDNNYNQNLSECFPLIQEENLLNDSNPYLTYPQINNNSYDIYDKNLMNESGLMNIYKTINFELQIENEFFDKIFNQENTPISLMDFYSDLIYLLQGLPSKTFYISNGFPFYFKINERFFNISNLRLIGNFSNEFKNILNFFINFGTKMNLIQYLIKNYIFKITVENYSFLYRKFYIEINDIIININENLITYKNLLYEKKMTFISLYNEIFKYNPILNIFLRLLYLNNEKNYEFIGNIEQDNYFKFYVEYIQNNNSSYLINNLLSLFNSFYHKNKIYFIVKNLLILILFNYLYFISNLIFSGQVLDSQNNSEFIMVSNKSNFALNNDNIPLFLQNYKIILLNNTILINLLQKYDNNYISVVNYKLKEFTNFLNESKIIFIDSKFIDKFILFKNEIFNKKIELMYQINQKILNEKELFLNKIRIKNYEKIEKLENNYKNQLIKEKKYKEEIQKSKHKYLLDIQDQILQKKMKIENEINKLKKENEEQKIQKELEEIYNKEIKKILMLKVEEINQKAKDIQIYGSLKNKWIAERNKLKPKRDEFFYNMYNNFDEFNKIYPEIYFGFINPEGNYHIPMSLEEQIKNDIKNINENIKKNEKVNEIKEIYNKNIKDSVKDLLNMKDIKIELDEKEKNNIQKNEKEKDVEMKDINEIDNKEKNIISNDKKDKKEITNDVIQKNLIKNPIHKFIISNMIIENIINPIIETAIEIAYNHQKEKIEKQENLSKIVKHSKTSNEINEEVKEIYNKINVILQEKFNTDQLNLKNIEIPMQIIFNEFFYDVILNQYKIVNNCLVLMLKNKFNLLNYFKYFNEIILGKSGNLLLNYIENIFEYKILSFKNNSTEFLTINLKNEILKTFNDADEFLEKKFLPYLTLIQKSKLNLKFTINNIDLSFDLNYNIIEPISLIFNESNMIYYDSIFKKIIKFIVYNQIFVKIFSVFKNIRDNEISTDSFFLYLNKILNKCYKTFKAFTFFLFHEILDKKYTILCNNINNSNDIFNIINEHNSVINNIREIVCKHKIINLIEKLCFDVSNFYLKSIILDYFDYDNLKNNELFKEMINLLNSDNNNIIDFIKNEYIIGDFYNLKNYI